jgi:hypothetical protein
MERAQQKRTIVQLATGEALAPWSGQLLSRLGYQIVMPEAFEDQRAQQPGLRPDLLLVDERHLAEVIPEEGVGEDPVPIVLLCGRHGATGADSRIVGAIKRPAGLHDLYRLLQQIFEDKPRCTLRVATQLRARCESGGKHWEGRVLSLSENGCLIRSSGSMLLGQQVRLEIALPDTAPIALEAEAAYQLLPDTGLVFHALAPDHRLARGRFVKQTLLGS